jgi:hypothetical protein
MVGLGDQLKVMQLAIGNQEVKEMMMVWCLELTIGCLKPQCALGGLPARLSCEENAFGVDKRRFGQKDCLCNILILPPSLASNLVGPDNMSVLFKPPAPGRERGGYGQWDTASIA